LKENKKSIYVGKEEGFEIPLYDFIQDNAINTQKSKYEYIKTHLPIGVQNESV
jgi:hypothetical protein